MYGERSSELLYSSVEFYMNNANRFYADHVYLATVEHLPPRPVIEKNVTVICIGESPRLSYYKEHATVILIKKKSDFFEVYSFVKDIFKLYQDWESRLLELFMKTPTIQDVLNCTYPVFERSIFILNADFQYVAAVYSDIKLHSKPLSRFPKSLDIDTFLAYLREKDLSMDKHGAFFVDFESDSFLCVNLFNSSAHYIGCLYVSLSEKPFAPGETKLVEYLAAVVGKICETDPLLLNQEQSTLKEALQSLMDELPLSKSQKLLLHSSNYKKEYFCISIHPPKNLSALPVSYVCSEFELLFSDSIFFEQSNTVLGLIPVELSPKTNDHITALENRMSEIIKDMSLSVGISNDFKDLYMIRTYYQQAEAAIENGRIYRPNEKLYLFSDFVLTELITNSLGGLPADTYFPKGFSDLLLHDRSSSVSYLDTLSVYLDENMSYTKAARRLYVHRSTLVERMERIEEELSLDLNNPDQRLLLQILLKALHIMEYSSKD